MKSIVEAAFLINLDRRSDRLGDWMKQLPNPWPFPEPERYVAIDGKRIPTPPQWKNGNGAWGCYRSHLNILERCLMEGIESYVVFEDDAGFADDFLEGFEKYIAELPEDWGLAYLGGQHLKTAAHPPAKVSEHVYRPYNVNRTHAFMVRGAEAMRILYRHLTWSGWQQNNHHIDHHLGRLVQREYVARVEGQSIDKERLPTYTPDRWLVGQLPSRSNICGRKWDNTRFFNDASKADHSSEPFYAVMGPHRSGTSCVAMVMHHLGVHMGNELGGYEETGGGEAEGLAEICEQAMKFPKTDPTMPDAKLARKLGAWIGQRKSEASRDQTVAGGKYPHMCRFGEHLMSAIGDSLRVIAVDRTIEDAIDSLNRRSTKNPGAWHSGTPEQNETLQRSLLTSREEFLSRNPDVPVLRVSYPELLERPTAVIQSIVAFIQQDCQGDEPWQPTDDELANARNHVDPSLNGAKEKQYVQA
jgi:GR25 family glycosyltransferase involved in LPS biosynthesis